MSYCHKPNIMFPFPVTFLILYSCNLPKLFSCIGIVGKLYNEKKNHRFYYCMISNVQALLHSILHSLLEQDHTSISSYFLHQLVWLNRKYKSLNSWVLTIKTLIGHFLLIFHIHSRAICPESDLKNIADFRLCWRSFLPDSLVFYS